jgi:hypothetical protein
MLLPTMTSLIEKKHLLRIIAVPRSEVKNSLEEISEFICKKYNKVTSLSDYVRPKHFSPLCEWKSVGNSSIDDDQLSISTTILPVGCVRVCTGMVRVWSSTPTRTRTNHVCHVWGLFPTPI